MTTELLEYIKDRIDDEADRQMKTDGKISGYVLSIIEQFERRKQLNDL
tara:strand:+ start:421 stop:564 length:144 start_codon:yes stop_codon:yes gene_type:complete